MEPDLQTRPLGLYIHIPWCLGRCPYCNFYALNYSRSAFADYYDTLLKEKQLWMDSGIQALSSVYFGGGTPSLLSAEQIKLILQDLELLPGAEITMELNPIQINEKYAQALASTPVNRLSLGVQSMRDEDLRYLGRRHKAGEISQKLQILREAGFTNISADFIYGLPGSHSAETVASLGKLLEMTWEHISCYLLELTEDGPLAKDICRLPEDEELCRQYEQICRLLKSKAYHQYEISNFAKHGRESRHNLLYWEGNDYLAWGAAAAGYFRGRRYQNAADIARYRAAVLAGTKGGIIDEDAQDEQDYIMMRLRLVKGLDFEEYKARFGKDFSQGRQARIRKLKQMALITGDAAGLRLDPRAYFISNAVIAELL